MSINRFSFALGAPANERYQVRKGVDILALLRALAARHQSVELYFGETEDVQQTQLIGINPAYEELLFAPGDDDAALDGSSRQDRSGSKPCSIRSGYCSSRRRRTSRPFAWSGSARIRCMNCGCAGRRLKAAPGGLISAGKSFTV